MSLQSLGNHEFDDGIEGLLPFLKSTNTTFPMISSNIDDSKLPVDQKLTDYIKKSTTVTINGKKIGIIGYVTTKTAVSMNKMGCIKYTKYNNIKCLLVTITNSNPSNVVFRK